MDLATANQIADRYLRDKMRRHLADFIKVNRHDKSVATLTAINQRRKLVSILDRKVGSEYRGFPVGRGGLL